MTTDSAPSHEGPVSEEDVRRWRGDNAPVLLPLNASIETASVLAQNSVAPPAPTVHSGTATLTTARPGRPRGGVIVGPGDVARASAEDPDAPVRDQL